MACVDSLSTTYQFSSWTPEFGKLSQVNIARMKKIRKGMIAFMQSNRSKVTKRPFEKRPFNKSALAELSVAHTRPNITMIHGFFNSAAAEAGLGFGVSGNPQNYNI